MTLPTTRDRVPAQTDDAINRRIQSEMEERARRYAANPERIGERLRELDAEWDIERTIQANAATIAFIGVALGFFAHPYWLLLPALVTAFLFQHALQGWCPPVPVLRRLGFRTAHEIERERQILKVLRGDFEKGTAAQDRVQAAVAATDAV